MQNVKEKMRNVKVAAVHFWSVRCMENPGDIPFERTTNTASEGSGISRWAVKKLAGMQWPHRILFEPDPRNQGKDRQPGNHKTPGNNKNLRASLFCATE